MVSSSEAKVSAFGSPLGAIASALWLLEHNPWLDVRHNLSPTALNRYFSATCFVFRLDQTSSCREEAVHDGTEHRNDARPAVNQQEGQNECRPLSTWEVKGTWKPLRWKLELDSFDQSTVSM